MAELLARYGVGALDDPELRAAWARSLQRSPATLLGGPVDLVNSVGGLLGMPVSRNPVLGSQWLAEYLGMPAEVGSPYADFAVGLTAQPVAGLLGQGLGWIEDAIRYAKPGPVSGSPAAQMGAVGPADVTRSRRRVGTTGQYVGAPPGVDSPQKLAAVVRKYVRTMEEGTPGREFYNNSSADIWARTGHDPALADQVAANLALLSRSNNVAGNTTMSAKGHVQAVTGDTINTGRFPSRDSPLLADLYAGRGDYYAGHKREPFSEQLSVAWAPERVGRGVNDMHEAEIMGYPSGKVGGATQHAYMDEVRARAIDLANRARLGGYSDWNTGTAQAAAWTGNKIRRGEVGPGDAAKDYSYFFPRMQVNATYESFPGIGTGHLLNAPADDFAAKLAFHHDPAGSWQTSAANRDIGYTAARLLPGPDVAGVGRFLNEVNPATVAQPVVAIEQGLLGPVLSESSKRALNLMEGARAYFDVQNAGAWHKVMKSKAPEYTAAAVKLPAMDAATMKSLAPLFETRGYWIASAPDGITVMANNSTAKGVAFAKDVRSILKGAGYQNPELTFGRLESGYIDYANAWKGAPGSVTMKLRELVDQAPATAGLLEQSAPYRFAAAARTERDLVAQARGWGDPRADVRRARKIFKADGWEGLWDAARQGIVPVTAILALSGGLLAVPDERPMQ